MKHLLPDPKVEKEIGNGFTVFSCQFDSGERANGNTATIRLGEDGKVMLFLCQSCIEQLNGQVLAPLFVEAMKHRRERPEYVLNIKKPDFGE
jgi:hypothetical protein